MSRFISSVCLFCFFFVLSTTGCASQLKDMKGITRVGYSIQVGAFTEVKNAERLTTKLQTKGIDAFYFRKDNNLYAVRFGDYKTRDAARRVARKLREEDVIGVSFIASPQDTYLTGAKKPELRSGKGPAAKSKNGIDMGAIAARTAERFVGIPYQWGGDNVVEGMDCSGFVRAVYNLCGVNIPRTSQEQFKVGDDVDKFNLKDGDLVFFGSAPDAINHVGIYVGNSHFVHAPRRGDEIKTSSLDEAYFAKKFIGARRYF